MSEKSTCQLCGEPMPEGEEMFNYHGYSGPCPKPPLPSAAAAESLGAADGLEKQINGLDCYHAPGCRATVTPFCTCGLTRRLQELLAAIRARELALRQELEGLAAQCSKDWRAWRCAECKHAHVGIDHCGVQQCACRYKFIESISVVDTLQAILGKHFGGVPEQETPSE